MELLDGRLISDQIKSEIKSEVDKILSQGKRAPHLVAILVGENGASITYVNSKVRSCKEVGFVSSLITYPETVNQEELLAKIEELNQDPLIDGFIVQLPLPKHIDEKLITQSISPQKDVDGFHPINIGKLTLGQEAFLPATPAGIIELLKRYEIETTGKHAVVIGRSNIVGIPISLLLAQKSQTANCTVTICHSHTKDIKSICRSADIIVAALGSPSFVTSDMVKEGAVVVDVGITRVADESKKSGFAIKGDVDFENVAPLCSYITPVPGGVGLMTIAMLMKNTLLAYHSHD